jgi:hypothetical protein
MRIWILTSAYPFRTFFRREIQYNIATFVLLILSCGMALVIYVFYRLHQGSCLEEEVRSRFDRNILPPPPHQGKVRSSRPKQHDCYPNLSSLAVAHIEGRIAHSTRSPSINRLHGLPLGDRVKMCNQRVARRDRTTARLSINLSMDEQYICYR